MNKIFLLAPWSEKKRGVANSLEFIKFYLIDSGYDAETINCAYYDRDYSEVISMLKRHESRIVGISGYTRERFEAYDLIRRVRAELPRIVIVAGGRHFGALAEETLDEFPQVDIVVRGEGEITFKEICDAVNANTDYRDILGISFREGERTVHNPDRPQEPDLDRFRCFDPDNMDGYAPLSNPKADPKNLYFSVLASRGCPNSCVFCSLTADKVRFRSPENIIEEIEAKIRATGVRNVSFIDSSLTMNKKFLVALCNKIMEKDLKIRWNCYSRADISVDLLKIMKEAGLVSIEVALESASPRVLKAIRKRIDTEQVENICKKAYELGIKVYVFCLISLPDERPEDVETTLAYIKRIAPYIHSAGIQVTRIMPDAALYGIAKQRNLLPPDFNWFKRYHRRDEEQISGSYHTLPVYLEHLTPGYIRAKLNEMEELCSSDIATFDTMRTKLRKVIDMEFLQRLTFKEFRRKSGKALKIFAHAYSNRRKFD